MDVFAIKRLQVCQEKGAREKWAITDCYSC